MIKINLLGQRPPKARPPVAAAAGLPALVLLIGLVAGLGGLLVIYRYQAGKLDEKQRLIADRKQEKAQLEQLKVTVEQYERQKAILAQRYAVIEELKANRVGGKELLDAVATTVTRTDGLWLTSMTRKGNSLIFEGTSGSIPAVANFITQLKRSGYFEKVEIKEAKQETKIPGVQTFVFTLSADFVLPGGKPGAAPAQPQARS